MKPIRTDFGQVLNDATSFNYPINVGECNKSIEKNRSLFIAVVSEPFNFNRRNIIRSTWLQHVKNNHQNLIDLVGFAFILGRTAKNHVQVLIERESYEHKDILQIDMIDTYYNLSMKAAALLNWLKQNCIEVDFILKVDDDVYVNSWNLAIALPKFSPLETYIYGRQAPNLKPFKGILFRYILYKLLEHYQ